MSDRRASGSPARAASALARRSRRGATELLRRSAFRLIGIRDLDGLKRAGMIVGDEVFVGRGCYFDPDFCFLITIEDRVTITVDVIVLVHDASTKRATGWSRVAPVTIGTGAFVGARSIILPGVTIGAGAVVGAGSVVRHDVSPHSVVAGNPAKVVSGEGRFVDRHRRAVDDGAPTWPRQGWTNATGITPERRREMLDALRHVPDGYIR
jgi:maltose O-acetyltransferase